MSAPLYGTVTAAEPYEEYTVPPASKHDRGSALKRLAGVVCATVAVVAGLAAVGKTALTSTAQLDAAPLNAPAQSGAPSHTTAPDASVSASLTASLPSENPSLYVSNYYEAEVLHSSLGDGYFFENLVQVHEPTKIIVNGTYSSCSKTFYLRDPLGVKNKLADNKFTTVRVGWHKLYLEMTCGHETSTYEYNVMSKYVRYEIRRLTEKHRERFFQALLAVYNTNQKEGEAKYGSKFRSAEYLVREHLEGAADKTCDHWHDDAGILTHHMAFTLEMEQSLQSVDPTVAIPYWDYTVDAYEYTMDTWTTSPIFLPHWFGAADPETEDHVITEGQWAYQSVMTRAESWSRVHNPYGLLRSPWNTNPTPYITRSRMVLGVRDGGWTTPSCTQFATGARKDSIADLFAELNGYLHGPIHIMIGGHWHYDQGAHNITAGLDVLGLSELADSFLLASKFLWRQGILRCPETCSSDTPSSECMCSCPSEIVDEVGGAYEVLARFGMFDFNTYFYEDRVLEAMGFSNETFVEFLCHVGHAGEMFTSAAPYDPTFWPLHGTAERFLSYKRYYAKLGKTNLITEWDYQHESILSDSHLVCDWDSVTGMELPKCELSVCNGHKADDLLPMGNFLDRNESYTNMEFFNLTAPWSEELPYTYDSYSSWPACSEQNITFFETSAPHGMPLDGSDPQQPEETYLGGVMTRH